MQNFHVSATGHSLNYLPEYLADWLGFFADEGISHSVTVPRPWDLVLDELASGKAAAALGGIWVPSMYFGRAARYTPFAQVSNRAPLAIVGRESACDFDWAALPGKVVAMKGSTGASAGLFAKLVMRDHGVDPRDVYYIQDLDGAMLSELFAGGMGDYLVIDYPSALACEAAGQGRIVAALPLVGGDVPWSVYYAQGISDDKQVQTQTRFTRALMRAMHWIGEHEAAEFSDFLAKTFPRFAPEQLVAITDAYRAHGMWTTPRIDEAAYERWQRGIAQSRLTEGPIAYADLIDPRPTAWLVSGER